jgi:type I restriction enzyme, S subunit
MTRAAQPVVVPGEWDLVPLSSVTTESVLRNEERQFGREGVLSVDNVKGFSPSDRLLGRDFSRYKLVRAGQFAYNPMRLNVGSIALKQDGLVGVVSPDYIVFGCNERMLNPQFLDFLRRSAAWRSQIQQSGQGSVRVRYYYRHIAEFLVPLPPLSEQRAIVAVLWTVERAKQTCEQAIVATRQLKQSLLHHLFTYGPVPFDQADKVTLQETEIGLIPDNWDIGRLGDKASIGNGSTPRRAELTYWQAGTIPWLTSRKVHDGVITHAEEFVTYAAREECHLPLVKRGVLLVALTGQGKTLGNSARLEIDACVSQHLAYVSIHDALLLPDFALAFLRSRYEQLQAVSRSGGSTKGALTCGFLKSLQVPLPPISEQRIIAAQLSAVDAKLAAEEKRRAALDALFRSLLHQLMTGQVRVADLADEHKTDGSMSPSEPGVALPVEAAP